MEAASALPRSRAIVRAILCANFLLFALSVIPVTDTWVDRQFLALRSLGFEDVAGRFLQVWIVGSTILATALFGLIVWKNRRGALAVRPIRFEGILLLLWWLVVLGSCLYGFVLGMAG